MKVHHLATRLTINNRIQTIFFATTFLMMISTAAYSKDIAGSYVASTTYGNIFCITITQHGEKIEGSFDEVDFKQIVPIENGVFRDNKLSFNVRFVVNLNSLPLTMTAKIIKDKPTIFFGHYNIGTERGDFILYSVQAKPAACRNLR